MDKLGKPPYREQVTLLGLRRFVDNLTDSNRRFDTLYGHRAKEKQASLTETSRDCRRELMSSYHLLVDYINIMAQVKKTKLHQDLLVLVNHHRKSYAELVARKGKVKKIKPAPDQLQELTPAS